jgi:hypothetical protein
MTRTKTVYLDIDDDADVDDVLNAATVALNAIDGISYVDMEGELDGAENNAAMEDHVHEGGGDHCNSCGQRLS